MDLSWEVDLNLLSLMPCLSISIKIKSLKNKVEREGNSKEKIIERKWKRVQSLTPLFQRLVCNVIIKKKFIVLMSFNERAKLHY